MKKSALKCQIAALLERVTALVAQVAALVATVAKLEHRLAVRDEANAKLSARIADLEARLRLNSRNSSKPPSSDGPEVPTRSTRTPSGKSPGAQDGHPGHHLEMVETPDAVREHRPRGCGLCGEGLAGATAEVHARHQVFDVPPIRVRVTEHRVLACRCGCGHVTRGARPADVPAAPAAYGPGVRALVAYLSARHYLPVARLAELLADVLGTPVSTGTVQAMVTGTADDLGPALAAIKAEVAAAPVVGSDETTVRESGKRVYAWVWHSARSAYLARGPSRAAAVHEREFPGGFPQATLVTDRLAAQLKTASAGKQTCLPHVIRRCLGLSDLPGATYYPADVAHALRAVCAAGGLGSVAAGTARTEARALVAEVLHVKYGGFLAGKERTLWRKLRALGTGALVHCLDRADVPADNSCSERVIRGVKVKTKVSTQFRSSRGTEAFLAIRSAIETALMRGLAPLRVLANPAILTD